MSLPLPEGSQPTQEGYEKYGEALIKSLMPEASINILEFPQNALNQQQRDVLLAYIDHFIPSEEPTREGLVEYGAALFETLTPEAAVNILRVPKDSLSQQQRDALLSYRRHFIPTEELTEEGTQGDSEALFRSLVPQTASNNLELPQNALSQQQRETLLSYVRHFVPAKGGSRTTAKKTRGRPRTKGLDGGPQSIDPGDSWGPIRKLKTLTLPDALLNYISSNRDKDASQFMSVHSLPVHLHTVPDQSPMITLVFHCIYLQKLRAHIALSHLHWLYLTIIAGHIGIRMFGSDVRLTDSQKTRWKEEVDARCSNFEDTEMAEMGLGDQDIANKVYQASQTMLASGVKLVWLCHEFGIGSPFLLVEQLTESFISRRFTREGYACDEAMKNLKKLKLAERAEETGANAVGKKMIEHLSLVYKVDELGSERPEGINDNGFQDEGQGVAES